MANHDDDNNKVNPFRVDNFVSWSLVRIGHRVSRRDYYIIFFFPVLHNNHMRKATKRGNNFPFARRKRNFLFTNFDDNKSKRLNFLRFIVWCWWRAACSTCSTPSLSGRFNVSNMHLELKLAAVNWFMPNIFHYWRTWEINKWQTLNEK